MSRGDSYADPMAAVSGDVLLAHCDWGTAAGKRWLAVGRIDVDGAAIAEAPERVGDPTTLLERLRRRANGSTVLIGFDFPIGVPNAYAERAGIRSFPGFLSALTAGDRASFFEVAAHPTDISVERPFYPAAPGSSKQQHLVDALGVRDIDDLRRVCEHPGAGRRAAAPLFWLVGAAQVGRAALSGWRDVLIPALQQGRGVTMWPFDGELAALLDRREVVIVETYPAEFYGHFHARPGPGGKRTRSGRAPACAALAAAADRLAVTLTGDARRALDEAFGDRADGEDRFDAFAGLMGMLNVVLGQREPGPPSTVPPEVIAVEGWIFGQETPGVAPPPVTPLERLATLLRQRNAIDADISALIGRPALPGHIGEFIAAAVFDIQLEGSANKAGHDGIFRSGPFAGATVNVKLYGKREGLLDIPPAVPGYFLVLTGPRSAAMTSRGGTRPLVIEEVFLFDGPGLVSRLQERGVRIGVATSVRTEEWEHARVWPVTADQPSLMTEHQLAALSLFSAATQYGVAQEHSHS